MCTFKDPEKRGDLLAAVNIKYPSGPLSDGQKRMVRQALGGGMGTSPRWEGGLS
jgi:hypothetical protein